MLQNLKKLLKKQTVIPTKNKPCFWYDFRLKLQSYQNINGLINAKTAVFAI